MSAEQQAAVDSTVALCREDIQSISGTVTVGRSGYLISEPENAKGEADFVSLVFRSGWCFEVIGILIAGMGFYKTGFLSARLSSRFYLTATVVGYAITGAVVLIGPSRARGFGVSDAVTTEWIFLPYGAEQIAGMLANASILLLLFRPHFGAYARWVGCSGTLSAE